jgi:hypothetical protein
MSTPPVLVPLQLFPQWDAGEQAARPDVWAENERIAADS